MTASDSSCVVFIPLYRLPLTAHELAALLRCLQLLPFAICIAHPVSLANEVSHFFGATIFSGFRELSLKAYPDSCFQSVSSYNRLLLSARFYSGLKSWSYLLIFQLDAWLLGGNLRQWLQTDYSYIGAPWPPLMGPDKANPDYSVGNGGLSLRRIDHVLLLLNSWRFRLHPVFTPKELAARVFNRQILHDKNFLKTLLIRLKRLALLSLSLVGFRNNMAYFVKMGFHEDHLYGILAPRVAPWFKVAPVAEAAAFAIECKPKEVLTRFGVDLPFGCHAWEKYDRDFYLQRFSVEFYSLSSVA
jgi:hypothetical protein